MKLITERQKIREVAEVWSEKYQTASTPGGWAGCGNNTGALRKAIHDRLLALNVETATAADVAAIIGNGLWTSPERCQECGQRCAVVVQLGEEPDYGSSTAWVCVECLRKALALAEGAHR